MTERHGPPLSSVKSNQPQTHEDREIDQLGSLIFLVEPKILDNGQTDYVLLNINQAAADYIHTHVSDSLPTNPFEYQGRSANEVVRQSTINLFQEALPSLTPESPSTKIDMTYILPKDNDTDPDDVRTVGWKMTAKFIPGTDTIGRLIFHGTDITEMVKANNEKILAELRLKYVASHDEVTGLYNRAFFNEQLEKAENSPDPVAVVFIDLNDFKKINDTFGHKAGDEALTEIANFLYENFRTGDLVARLGGDEFGVILTGNDLTEETLIEKKNQINSKLAELNEDRDKLKKPLLSLSLGTAFALRKNNDPLQKWDTQTAFDTADKKMYLDKQLHKAKLAQERLQLISERNPKTLHPQRKQLGRIFRQNDLVGSKN